MQNPPGYAKGRAVRRNGLPVSGWTGSPFYFGNRLWINCFVGILVGTNAILTLKLLYIFFLDKKNALIADEVQQTGTVDHTPVYPREVVRRALELSATAIILVHNHPSGDPTPSRADIDMTKTVIETAKSLGIAVHDHIIVGKNGHTSLKGLKLI